MMTKSIAVIMVALLLYSNLALAAETTKYCKYTYPLKSLPSISLLCSRSELTTTQYNYLHLKVNNTMDMYPAFAKSKVFKQGTLKRVAIVVLSYKELNDPKLFGKKSCTKKVVARYFPEIGIIYVMPSALAKGVTDLPHELAHWINEHSGEGGDGPRDEALAIEFEMYYLAH